MPIVGHGFQPCRQIGRRNIKLRPTCCVGTGSSCANSRARIYSVPTKIGRRSVKLRPTSAKTEPPPNAQLPCHPLPLDGNFFATMVATIPTNREWAGMKELPPKASKALQAALQKARQWRRSPHWDRREWHKELNTIAQAITFEVFCSFDERRGVPLETFLFRQVLTALREFHWQEWAYFAVHCGYFPKVADEGRQERVTKGRAFARK